LDAAQSLNGLDVAATGTSVLTDAALTEDLLGEAWAGLGRGSLPFETSHPGLFAVGDLRSESVKRVASAVGEGSAAVRAVHQHLAFIS
jgi:thioredoxin reductase (NADPH)